MRTPFSLGLVPLFSSLVAALSLNASQCGGDDDDDTPSSRLLVGASVVTLLPEVDGTTAYFDALRDAPLALEPGDPGDDPGVFVEEWDVGTIAIGNGELSSHWAHDEIRAGAVAFKDLDQPDGMTLVMVSADVYMLFRQDIQEIYDKVHTAVGDDAYSKLWITVTATHNHMGPDTSGLDAINHRYYDYMTSQIASAILDAIDERNMKAAELRVATSRYQFGMADSHAPYIVDPTLNSMQVVSSDDPGQVIATLVQWQNHPEDTLGFGKDIYATDEQADYLRSIDECLSDDDQAHCYVEGQMISAGFAGYAMKRLMDDTGAPALYFNGPVGGLLAPLHAYVWETEGEQGQPAGDGVVIPDGAVLIDKNFHKQAVNGMELAKRVEQDLEYAEIVTDPAVSMLKKEFYTRLTNLGFRIGMSVKADGQPLMLGHLKRDLYTCPDVGTRDDSTCVSDNYESAPDPYLKLPVRVGTFGKTEAQYLRIGPVGMVTIPAEAVSEVIEGLPSDFVSDPRNLYLETDENRANHVPADEYSTGGYARQAMPDTYKWALGLTQDELGYAVPISDWRIFCVADEADLGGTEGTCAALRDAGIMEFQDYDGQQWAISGARCKSITEDPSLLEQPPYTNYPNGGELARMSCYYGQTWNDADGHYEETESGGWDAVEDWLAAFKELVGWSGDLEEVNPDFVGENLRN